MAQNHRQKRATKYLRQALGLLIFSVAIAMTSFFFAYKAVSATVTQEHIREIFSMLNGRKDIDAKVEEDPIDSKTKETEEKKSGMK